MPLDILVGLQYGDEGKGKVVDSIAPEYAAVVRFNGGNNAGHTVQFNDTTLKLHSIPSGIAHPEVLNIIGRGCVINPSALMAEIQSVQLALGRTITLDQLLISEDCHIITDENIQIDQAKSQDKIGTTGRGIGPTYSSKHFRSGLKLKDVISAYPMLAGYTGNAEAEVQKRLNLNENILAEGAQGTWLDIDHGQYPYVTSCNTLASHACTTLGVGINRVRDVLGVFKAYTTRVGEGFLDQEWTKNSSPYTDIFNTEVGTTTGRSRRCGPLNLPELKIAIEMNGITKLIMTKSDMLNGINFDVIEDEIHMKSIEGWKDCSELDENFMNFVYYIFNIVGVSIDAVSNGPNRKDYTFNRLFKQPVLN